MSETHPEFQSRLDFALEVAQECQELILRYYQRADLRVESKNDDTPVTVADRGAEQLIRERLEVSFPDDGILGEEFPEKPGRNEFRWILDPIDGTKSFVHGVPLFGTLFGLEYQQQCVVGVCRFPALNEVVYASQGGGAYWKIGDHAAEPARVSSIATLEESCFCTTNVSRWEKFGKSDAYEKLCSTVKLTRGWGDCFGHILVATGRAEIMVDPVLSEWDAAALLPILQEAGGHFVDWHGNPTIYNKSGISVNDAMKQTVLETLAATDG